MRPGDHALEQVLARHQRFSGDEAGYRVPGPADAQCEGCKFFIELDEACFVTAGKIVSTGGCRHFTAYDQPPLPGDLAWAHVQRAGHKLSRLEGFVIRQGDAGWQCKDCKFYIDQACLIIEGPFKPEMSCRYIIKVGEGTPV
jgi:hypothetical protein